MSPTRRRVLLLVSFVLLFLVASAVLYMLLMERLEGKPRDFWTALEWAAETITSVGYGVESGWHHPVMVMFVVSMQFAGLVLIYSLVPIFLLPYLEERFEVRLPRKAPAKLKGHVVIYNYGPSVESLLGELRDARMPTLVVEPQEHEARLLVARGVTVVHLDATDALEAARVETARTLIANGSDEENAAVILHARHLGFEGEILALVDDPNLRQPMSLAGANAVYTPRHLLATALTARASPKIQPRVSGIQHLGRHLEVSEIRVDPASVLAGKTLTEADLRGQTGTTVIGQWVAGRMIQPDAGMVVRPRGILVAVGRQENLAALAEKAGGAGFERRGGPYVIAGCGVVGDKVRQVLTDAGEEVVVIDRQAQAKVDIVGDILDSEVLAAARLDEARAILLALDSDSATMFATVVIRDRVPEIPIIARVNEASNVERIHRAGADFALSVSHVAGQILARKLLSQEAIHVDPHMRVLKVQAPTLASRPLAGLFIRTRTGCSVVAVERGDEVIVNLSGEFTFERDDTVYICGSNADTRRFTEAFG